MRSHAAHYLLLSTVGPGQVYDYLLDGYIDAGRDDELQAALHEAWQQEPEVVVTLHDTPTRKSIARAYLHLRRRQYLHEHPELAEEISVGRNIPLEWDNATGTWGRFTREDHEFLSDRLIENGDEEYIEVMTDYRERYKGW